MSGTEPSDARLPDSAEVERALVACNVSVDPYELHGSLCGYVAGGGRVDPGDWLQRLQIEADPDAASTAVAATQTLEDLREATLAQFENRDFGLELLAPDEDAPLAERADALIAWCRGFLGGFGLAAPPSGALTAEALEALADIGRIAAADLGYDGSEADEDALAEISEFVRIAALLLHGDCSREAQRRKRMN